MRRRIAPLTAAGLILISGINAGLLALLMRQEESQAQQILADSESSPILSSAAILPVTPKRFNSYPETLAHPVFHKTRLPYTPPPPAPAPAAAKPAAAPVIIDPGLVLGGVTMDGSLKKVYVFSKGNPEGAWISEGEAFLGWTVQSIDSDTAKLKQGTRTLSLDLYPSR
jgi:hypothetical protein